jgi:hypothetical protein
LWQSLLRRNRKKGKKEGTACRATTIQEPARRCETRQVLQFDFGARAI